MRTDVTPPVERYLFRISMPLRSGISQSRINRSYSLLDTFSQPSLPVSTASTVCCSWVSQPAIDCDSSLSSSTRRIFAMSCQLPFPRARVYRVPPSSGALLVLIYPYALDDMIVLG